MGHYLVISGYDDGTGRLITQDSLLGPDRPRLYTDFESRWWRDFNYTYLVVYPPDRELVVQEILGLHMDVSYNYQFAAQRALAEIPTLTGRDQLFAWFNLGSSLVNLEDFQGAAEAYDAAFALYMKLPEDDRPYRLMWYQSGPYAAYYHVGRYQDVVKLADITFQWVGQPVLEESYYWRGMAFEALGNLTRAIADLQKAAALNPYFNLPRQELNKLGVQMPLD
jgi:tetratricopeptide (TPR) repeat protein